jgi:UDP-glucose 4-epimerase
MTTKRVLVTGASGFVGRPLVGALAHAGYAVRVAVRRPVSFPSSVDVVIVPDLENFNDWDPILQGVDIVIHLAGLAHADQRDIPFGKFDKINWIATLFLANAAKKAGIKRFVYISSVRAQVGASAAQTIHEEDKPHPTDHYGRSKLAAEWAIRAAGVPFTIFRPVVIYGPHPKGNIRTLVRLAQAPLPLPVAGLTNRRSLLAIDNLVSAIVFALNNPVTVGETYLLADPAPMRIGEIFASLRKVQGRLLTNIYVPEFIIRLALMMCGRKELWSRLGGALVVDTSKLESLGWRAVVDTHEGFLRMMLAENGESAQPLVLRPDSFG